MAAPVFSPGLEGIVAGETAVACVDQGRLLYRGYAIQELAEKATFEEVLHLLLYGDLPAAEDLASLKARLFEYRSLPAALVEMLRPIPAEVPMMDVLRSAVSYAGHWDPVEGDDEGANQERAVWLTAQIPGIIAARYRLMNGQEPMAAKAGLDHAAQVLYQCHGEAPSALASELVDLTLVLYAEHEFNASTFTCRVICSTLSDLTSAVVGGIGALKGPLHGGANEAAMEMLQGFPDAEAARVWTQEALARKEKVMGFGHRVYKHGDHRAFILEDKLRQLAQQLGQQRWMDIYDAIKDPMVKEKKIFPNVDYPCGLTYYLLGLPLDLYTPLFVASRVAGWCAHYLEQKRHNRIYRPLSAYIGAAERPVPGLDER